jgi:hypothetical protein
MGLLQPLPIGPPPPSKCHALWGPRKLICTDIGWHRGSLQVLHGCKLLNQLNVRRRTAYTLCRRVQDSIPEQRRFCARQLWSLSYQLAACFLHNFALFCVSSQEKIKSCNFYIGVPKIALISAPDAQTLHPGLKSHLVGTWMCRI